MITVQEIQKTKELLENFKEYISVDAIVDGIVNAIDDNGMHCESCFLSEVCEYFKEVKQGNEWPDSSCTITIYDFITSD